MAFSTFGSHGGGGVGHQVYNIDWTVGAGCTNLREDVMLVQALFSILYYHATPRTSYDFQPPDPTYDSIDVDGFMGPITRAHIQGFQAQLVKRGMAKAVDLRMDPFRKYGQPSSIQKVLYAVDQLNEACYQRCLRESSSAYWMLPYTYGEWPPELISALKATRDKPRQYGG